MLNIYLIEFKKLTDHVTLNYQLDMEKRLLNGAQRGFTFHYFCVHLRNFDINEKSYNYTPLDRNVFR